MSSDKDNEYKGSNDIWSSKCFVCCDKHELSEMSYVFVMNNVPKQVLVCKKCYEHDVCKGCGYLTGKIHCYLCQSV